MAEFAITSWSFAQNATTAVDPNGLQITVKLMLVLQSDVCKGIYKPGHKDCPISESKIDDLKRKHRVSRSYHLTLGKLVPLPLEQDFQQALTSAIDAGNYAVLIELDWGKTMVAVVDMVRDSSGPLPEWTSPHPQLDSGQYWYTHQDAIDFEPGKSVKWQVTLNGALSVWFYVVPGV
jgi:hypothetical protein